MTNPGQNDAEMVHTFYSRAGMHVSMLIDVARTTTYRQALARYVPGKIVLEIGCGAGVLACFASRSGASRVYAIEETQMIESAKEIARLNNLADNIVFIAGNSLKVEIPERADVVYSELMGSDPLGESLLPALRDASERFLAPNGTMIPDRLSVGAVCLHSDDVAKMWYATEQGLRRVEELGKTYGLDLTPLVTAYRAEVRSNRQSYHVFDRVGGPLLAYHWDLSNEILTDEAILYDFDLLSTRSFDTPATIPLTFEARRPGQHNAMAVYFTTYCREELFLTTSPFGIQLPINWGQLICPVEPMFVNAGDVIALEATIDVDRVPTVCFRRP